MICKNCSHENAPEESVCSNCGMPLNEDAELEMNTAEKETSEEAVCPCAGECAETASEEKPEEENIGEENCPCCCSGEAHEIISEENGAAVPAAEGPAPKKKSKIMAFSGLIALIIICIGLWVAFTGIFAPKYVTPVDRSKFALSYVKDFCLYQKPVSGSPVKISDKLVSDTESGFSSYSYTVKQSKDGKVVYFLENFDPSTFSGTLYACYNGKDKVKIADNALQGFVISENGKTVMYMSNVDINTAIGQLYYCTEGLQPQQLANSTLYQTFMVSENGKSMAYLENVNSEDSTGEYYVAKTGGAPVKVDDAVISGVKVSNGGEVLYLKNMDKETYTCDLYKSAPSKTPELISNGVSENYVMASSFSDKVGYVTIGADQVYNFDFKNGNKEAETVLDDIMGFFAVDVENQNYLLAKLPDGADASSASPDMLLKKKGKDAITVASGMLTPQHASASYDFKTIYYLCNYDQASSAGVLHVRKESLFGVKDEVIAEGVGAFNATKDGSVVIYITNINSSAGTGTLNAYKDGSTKQIAEGIYSSTYKLSTNGKTVTYLGDIDQESYTGTLYTVQTTGSSQATAIDSGVYSSFYTRSDKNAIYFKNFNSDADTGDLYMWKGSGTPEAVDTGVSSVLFE